MERANCNHKLSVCIPNYNRIGQLERLVRNLAEQIVSSQMEEEIELCVSDDCSPEDPGGMIDIIKRQFPTVDIVYERSKQNMGMDHNFLKSVLIAHGQYAWIVGNDDLPEEGALNKIISATSDKEYTDVDIIVTPFDAFDYNKQFVRTVYPLGSGIKSNTLFDTSHREQMQKFIRTVNDNSALFGFLSNVVFKRSRWLEHGDMFADKMSSIFIQVYMNLQTLMEGARYLYVPRKIIRNFIDDETNETIDRAYRTTAGFYDAMDYFFQGEERKHIEEKAVDYLIGSIFMELAVDDERKRKTDSFVSEKMDMLKKYYIRRIQRQQYFEGKSVIVYGAGKFGHLAVDELIRYKADVIGICDADVNKQGGCIREKLIFDFDTLLMEYDRHEGCIVVIANNAHLVPIIKMLVEHSVLRLAVIT